VPSNKKKPFPKIEAYDLITGKKAVSKPSLNEKIQVERFIDLFKKNLGFHFSVKTGKAAEIEILAQGQNRFEDFKNNLPEHLCLFSINTPTKKNWGYLIFDGNLLNALINTSLGASNKLANKVSLEQEKIGLTRFELPIIENIACSIVDELKKTLDSLKREKSNFSLSPNITRKNMLQHQLPNQEYHLIEFALIIGIFGGILTFAFNKDL